MGAKKFHKDYEQSDINIGYSVIVGEMLNANLLPRHPLRKVFQEAWESFERNEWSIDDEEFLNERFPFAKFEMAGFILAWRKATGFFGFHIDREFFSIAVLLNYKPEIIYKRMHTAISTVDVKDYEENTIGECPLNLITV